MNNKQNNQISFRADDTLYDKIQKRAKEENRTLSAFIKNCIVKYIDKLEEVEKMRG